MDSGSVCNEHAENPTPPYNDWSKISPQIPLPDTQYVDHDCNNNSCTPGAIDPLFANLDQFSGLGTQHFDFLLMQDSLLRDNVSGSSDKSTPQSFNHSMQAPPEDESSTMPESAPESKPSPPPLICPWRGCKKPGPFGKKETLDRHVQTQHVAPRAFKCPQDGCNRSFSRKDNLNQHRRAVHHHVIRKSGHSRSVR